MQRLTLPANCFVEPWWGLSAALLLRRTLFCLDNMVPCSPHSMLRCVTGQLLGAWDDKLAATATHSAKLHKN